MAPLEPHVPSLGGWLSSVRASATRARVAAVVVAVAVAVAVGWWLVRPSRPPVELTLPRATTGSVAGSGAGTLPASTSSATLLVQIAGAISRPGVYSVRAGARVTDVVDAAGGPTSDADVNVMALAVPVHDGERIYVPKVGEAVPASAGATSAAPGASRAGASGGASGPLDLNKATATELDQLPGIGPSLAAAIVAYRDKHGRFRQVDDLNQVPGIGPTKVDALRGLVTV